MELPCAGAVDPPLEMATASVGEIESRSRRWLAGSGRCPQLVGPQGGLSLDLRLACTHACGMSKMVQIRKVPDALHRKLKVRAASLRQTLSDYLLAELERLAARPDAPRDADQNSRSKARDVEDAGRHGHP